MTKKKSFQEELFIYSMGWEGAGGRLPDPNIGSVCLSSEYTLHPSRSIPGNHRILNFMDSIIGPNFLFMKRLDFNISTSESHVNMSE